MAADGVPVLPYTWSKVKEWLPIWTCTMATKRKFQRNGGQIRCLSNDGEQTVDRNPTGKRKTTKPGKPTHVLHIIIIIGMGGKE
jgi:hypothetical protein